MANLLILVVDLVKRCHIPLRDAILTETDHVEFAYPEVRGMKKNNKPLPYMYVMTYETVTDEEKPRPVVRNVEFRTDGPIKTSHQMESAEILISIKREQSRPVKIVDMKPMFEVRSQEFKRNDEGCGRP
ncbi:hypothetical protein LCGC14_0472010 [marine sediment metagenome]|uniref:Uncharacterized protein n=1 Tax=marine sediment metagenome TaxID=412755 RepID=A0A0F9SBY7_9ZZZZ